jgi:hypothetical protein
MEILTVIQGNTTDVFLLEAEGYPDISSANWTGRAILSPAFGATPTIDRALGKAATNTGFLGYLTHTETAALTIGTTYALAYEVTNTVVVPPLKHQFQFFLKVTAKA